MKDVLVHEDKSCMVEVTCRIGSLQRTMWLAVMNYKHESISNPSTAQINKAKMRCLVKCMALYGLGHYIYAGEDLPPDEDGAPQKEPVVVHEHILSLLDVARNSLNQYDLKALDHWMGAEFTQRWIDVAKRQHPEIHQEIRAACVARKKELEKEEKEKNG